MEGNYACWPTSEGKVGAPFMSLTAEQGKNCWNSH